MTTAKNEWISLPDPPDTEAVEDQSGRTFSRISEDGMYWNSAALGPGRGTYHWADLLIQRGPVRGVEA